MNLKPFHTFGISAECREITFLSDIDTLVGLADGPLPLILGSGSNILPYQTITKPIVINQLKGITIKELEGCFLVRAAAGENWHDLVMYCIARGMPGLENLALIPGTVGAAPIQNIGAYGVEQGSFCESVELFNWNTKQVETLDHRSCKFGYRDSTFKRNPELGVITAVTYKLPKSWEPHIGYAPLRSLEQQQPLSAMAIANRVIETRQSKLPDPKQLGNAGSFFKNPRVTNEHRATLVDAYPDLVWFEDGEGYSKLAAGWLIDKLGLKGYTVGDASVHQQQALVLVNLGTANAADVIRLAGEVRAKVNENFSILLEPEVQLIGRDGRTDLDTALDSLNA
ncbi:UDP-N-acetylmuramate dehydrogenase [Corallincola platygyrae]|uniref:UDP-N-acetylenolpyruvoylglucosamine reductase n=1 Tax=Corallincola platygyrae TaxID=1193278 RepID=A0ABW4XRA3_9GAMM